MKKEQIHYSNITEKAGTIDGCTYLYISTTTACAGDKMTFDNMEAHSENASIYISLLSVESELYK